MSRRGASSKRQHEAARRERAERKEQRRADRQTAPLVERGAGADESTVLEALAVLHRRFVTEEISAEEFAVEKAVLLGGLDVR